MRVLVSFLVLVLLAACQTRPVAPERLSQLHSIGVLSTLGDELTLRAIGITVFGNGEQSFAAPEPDLDGFVARRIVAACAGRYEARRVELDRTAPGRADLIAPAASPPLADWSKFIAALRRQVATQPPVDAWVVVTPATAPWGTTNQSVRGVGLLRAGGGVNSYAAYWVTIVGGGDFAVLGTAYATQDRGGFNSLTPRRFVQRRADPKLWSDSPASLAPERRGAIEDGVKQLLAETLPDVLKTVGLVP